MRLEQIGIAGFSPRPYIIKTARQILLRVLKIFTFRLKPSPKNTLPPPEERVENGGQLETERKP